MGQNLTWQSHFLTSKIIWKWFSSKNISVLWEIFINFNFWNILSSRLMFNFCQPGILSILKKVNKFSSYFDLFFWSHIYQPNPRAPQRIWARQGSIFYPKIFWPVVTYKSVLKPKLQARPVTELIPLPKISCRNFVGTLFP